jgi:hypothetical protein
MNTWNPKSASCHAPEDKMDGMQDTGVFGVSGATIGKLSYRNLIFGNNGRKQNRPISERTRIAESIFATQGDDDAVPSVMYNQSSMFVCRSKPAQIEDNEEMSVLELMTHSNLWAQLRAMPQSIDLSGEPLDASRIRGISYDMLPTSAQTALKELLVYLIGTQSLTADEIVAQVQQERWENFPGQWSNLRNVCTENVVIPALCELVREDRVESLQTRSLTWTMKDWNPVYRCTSAKKHDPADEESNQSSVSHHESKCIKISKPWKRFSPS